MLPALWSSMTTAAHFLAQCSTSYRRQPSHEPVRYKVMPKTGKTVSLNRRAPRHAASLLPAQSDLQSAYQPSKWSVNHTGHPDASGCAPRKVTSPGTGKTGKPSPLPRPAASTIRKRLDEQETRPYRRAQRRQNEVLSHISAG